MSAAYIIFALLYWEDAPAEGAYAVNLTMRGEFLTIIFFVFTNGTKPSHFRFGHSFTLIIVF